MEPLLLRGIDRKSTTTGLATSPRRTLLVLRWLGVMHDNFDVFRERALPLLLIEILGDELANRLRARLRQRLIVLDRAGCTGTAEREDVETGIVETENVNLPDQEGYEAAADEIGVFRHDWRRDVHRELRENDDRSVGYNMFRRR